MQELKAGLASFGVELTDPETARIMRRFDVTGDGVIHYFEFLKMVQGAINLV